MSFCPPSFAKRATERSARSVERVRAAIALLQSRGDPVTLRRITAAAQELEADSPRLAESVITRNPGAYALYDAARSGWRRRPKRPRQRDPWLERKTKADLIDIIRALRDRCTQLELCLRENVFGNDGTPPGAG